MSKVTVDQVVSVTASIGACLAAVAAFLAVWQMSEQRRASYMPELVLARGVFQTVADGGAVGLAALLDWQEWVAPSQANEQIGQGNKPSPRLTDYSLRLANIGLGAAKNVVVTWSFPFESIIQKTREAALSAATPAPIEYKNGIVTLATPRISSMWRNQQKETFDFVLHAAVEEMVLAQGLGDADRQAPRSEKGDRGAGASVGRDPASYLG